MSSVLFLFLTHLGIGIAATLLLVGRDAGVKFFRFNAGLAVVLLLIALAFQPPALSNGVLETIGTAALVLATLLLLVYWASGGRVRPVRADHESSGSEHAPLPCLPVNVLPPGK